MRQLLPLVFVLAGLTAACGGLGPQSPTSPSSSLPKPKSIKVVGPPLGVGDTVQFNAAAVMPDGTEPDITGTAKWTSSNTAVATVTATGMVSALTEGTVDIKAALQGMTGTNRQTVKNFPTFTALGIIKQAPPGFSPLAGVQVQVTSGHDIGRSTTTDGNGYYSLGGLRQATFTLEFSRDGLISIDKQITLNDDKRLDLLMYDTPPPGATARCRDKKWSYATDARQACARDGGVAYAVCPGPLCSGH